MGPFDKEKLWNSAAISGCRRFLDRFYALVLSDKVSDGEQPEAMALAHKLVHGVQKDIEALLFNTAISKMMTFVNALTKLKTYPKKALEMATLTLSSFAPHLAEECWEHLGHQESLAYAPFPKADPNYLIEEQVTYVIQVNGKFRAKWELPKGQTEQALLQTALQDKRIETSLAGEIVKVIFVPDKLLNIVVKG